MEFKIKIFQTWKVMENQLNGCHIFNPCTLNHSIKQS